MHANICILPVADIRKYNCLCEIVHMTDVNRQIK